MSNCDVKAIVVSVRARIVSFGEVLAIPWKSNLVLDCLNVGIPSPAIQWHHRSRLIRDNSKYRVSKYLLLSIKPLK